MSSPSPPSPFTINVPDAVLRDLADRLARTRFPERTAAPWRAGTDPDYLRELIRQWIGPTRGGHFLALEEPGLLATDLRSFFRPLRGN